MANNENLIPFDKRTESEAREISSRGGKASGETRRKKADFRRTLNALLTSKIDSPEWTPMLEALGLDSTLEAAVNAAMIKEALTGNVKAYEAIAKFTGQTDKTDADQEEQQVRMDAAKSRSQSKTEEDVQDDGFIDALRSTAEEDWNDKKEETGI